MESYSGHLSHGHTYKLQKKVMSGFTLTHASKEEEQEIFSDGVKTGEVTKGNIGITYQIGLKDLINRRILSKPIFESCYTEETFGDNLGLDDWGKINDAGCVQCI